MHGWSVCRKNASSDSRLGKFHRLPAAVSRCSFFTFHNQFTNYKH